MAELFDFKTVVTLLFILFFIVSGQLGKISLTTTALIVVAGFILTGVLTPEEALSGFSDTNIVLVVAMYVVSAALMKTHLIPKIIGQLKRKKSNPSIVVCICCLVNMAVFQFVNGIAAIALLLPLEMAVCEDEDVGLTLPQILYPTFLAGIMAMGWLPLPKAIQKVGQYNAFLTRMEYTEQIEMWKYVVVQIPMVLLSFLFLAFVAWKWLPKGDGIDEGQAAKLAKRGTGYLKSEDEMLHGTKEILCYIICAATILLMLLGDVIGVSAYLIAMIGALILVVSGMLSGREAIAGVQWSAVLMIAAMLPLATAVKATNVSTIASTILSSLLGGIKSEILVLAILFIIPCIITQFMNNSVVSSSFTPLVIAAIPSLGLNPAATMILMDFACNKAMMLPTVTASTTVVWGVAKYKPLDMVKIGLIPSLLSLLTCCLLLPLLY